MARSKLIATLLLIASVVRLWLFHSSSLQAWLENRLEIASPLTSWNRVLEGIFLKKQIGLSSTYEGDLVHELPMMLYFYELLIKLPVNIRFVFILFDCLNALLVCHIVRKGIQTFYITEKNDLLRGKFIRLVTSLSKEELNKFLLNTENFNADTWSLISFGVYLFNPFCIASCVARSTVIIHNSMLLLWLFFLVNDKPMLSFFFLSIHANLTIYSASLMVASIFLLNQKLNKKQSLTKLISQSVIAFLSMSCGVFCLNLWFEDFNTRFIKSTYMFILEVPDLVPNLGVFWYFFTEMFDHFRLFFTYVFQFNVLLYAVPISIRLRNDPIVSILIQIGLISTLKSYPSIGEIGMFFSFLPMVAFLFPLARNFLIYSCMLLASVVLAPIMFYLWVGSGGGNANFYFAITLVYTVGLIFLIVDLFYAQLKREFIKFNGPEIPKSINGKLAKFHLE